MVKNVMTFTSKKHFLNGKNLVILAVIGLIALFIAKSDIYIKTTSDGLKIWALTIVPSLLPFFFLTSLLTKTASIEKFSVKTNKLSRFLYGAQGISLYVRIMSILSGYPVGAKIICDLYKNKLITSKQAEKYSTFTSTSGPLFIVGAVAIGMFNDKTCGFIMLISHLFSSMLVGVIFKKLPDNGLIADFFDKNHCDNVLYDTAYSAVISVLIVGAFSSVFYTFSQMATDLKILMPIEKPLSLFLGEDLSAGVSAGLIECTRGALILSQASNKKLAVSLTTSIISLGGLSVWFQSLAYLKTAKIRISIFLLSKILHSIIAFLICYILLSFQ